MRKVFIVGSLILLFLVGCGGSGDAETTTDNNQTPSSEQQATGSPDELATSSFEDIPRTENTPEPGLPPTWTPSPTESQGHLGATNGGGGSNPSNPGAVETRMVYVVQPGDTLAGIAAYYGVDLADIVKINRIQNQDLIEVGDSLVLPIEVTATPTIEPTLENSEGTATEAAPEDATATPTPAG